MQPYKHSWSKIEAERKVRASKADTFEIYFKTLSVTTDYLIRWAGKKIKANVPVHLLFKKEGKLEFKKVKVAELIQEKTIISLSVDDYKRTWWIKGG